MSDTHRSSELMARASSSWPAAPCTTPPTGLCLKSFSPSWPGAKEQILGC